MSGRNGVQIPNTKSQFCQVAATLCKSIEFFHIDPLPSHSVTGSCTPGKHTGQQCHSLPPCSPMPATNSTTRPQHARMKAEKPQTEQRKAEAASTKRCPYVASSATWPASFQGCISEPSVTFQDGHLSQGQPSICFRGVSSLTHCP